MTSDYQRYFANPSLADRASDPVEEVHARVEAADLKPCPCCNGPARVLRADGVVKIACGKVGCRIIEGRTMKDAAALWNEARFSESKIRCKITATKWSW